MWLFGEELLNVSLQLLVASLSFISAALSISQADLQGGHTAAICLQSRLELCHCGLQLLVLLLQTARDHEETHKVQMYSKKAQEANLPNFHAYIEGLHVSPWVAITLAITKTFKIPNLKVVKLKWFLGR